MLSGEALEMCGIPSCPRRPVQSPGQWDLSLTDPFGFAHPTCPSTASWDRGLREDGDPMNPGILSLLGLGFGCFLPVVWSDSTSLSPAISLCSALLHLHPHPRGGAHAVMHTLRPTAPGHGEAMEPRGSAGWLPARRRHEPLYGAQITQAKRPP